MTSLLCHHFYMLYYMMIGYKSSHYELLVVIIKYNAHHGIITLYHTTGGSLVSVVMNLRLLRLLPHVVTMTTIHRHTAVIIHQLWLLGNSGGM